MPEAVKESSNEVAAPPQPTKEEVVDKVALIADVKPTEASSGTLPAGEEKITEPVTGAADGNGAVAVEAEVAPLTADPVPEEGKSEEPMSPQPSNETDKSNVEKEVENSKNEAVAAVENVEKSEEKPVDTKESVEQNTPEVSSTNGVTSTENTDKSEKPEQTSHVNQQNEAVETPQEEMQVENVSEAVPVQDKTKDDDVANKDVTIPEKPIQAAEVSAADDSKAVPEESPSTQASTTTPVECSESKNEESQVKDDEKVTEKTVEPDDTAELEDAPSKEQMVEDLLRDGRELIIKRDFYAAADAFGKACEMSSECFGELADRNAETYFLYGSAMLETGKAENTVLGENVKEKDEDDDVEEEDDEADDGGEEGDEKDNDEEKEEAMETEEADITVNGVEEPKANGVEPSSSSGQVNGVESTSESPENQVDSTAEEKEEEDTPLKVAWEMFELAKVIFERAKNEKRLADTYMKLGEVGVESGHANAMDDMLKALEIRKTAFPPGHRIIPETHFNIGLAYSMFQLFDEAVIHFEESKKYLVEKIKDLEQKGTPEALAEAKEIQDLLPDLDEKIQDMSESKEEKAKEEAVKANGAEPSSSSASTSKSAQNISHLIKRKRTVDEQVERAPKQPCTENSEKEAEVPSEAKPEAEAASSS